MADADDVAGELPGDLAELEHVAAAADAALAGAGAPGAPGAAVAEPVQVDRGTELGAMLQMVVTMGTPALPFLPQCYTPEVCQQIGTAFAAVAEKHGWNLDVVSSPELALAVVALPPTVAAVYLGRAYFVQKRAAAEAAARAARTQPLAAPAPMPAPAPEPAGAHAGIRLQPIG